MSYCYDKVLFDIHKTPNSMTGSTPFKLFSVEICARNYWHYLITISQIVPNVFPAIPQRIML